MSELLSKKINERIYTVKMSLDAGICLQPQLYQGEKMTLESYLLDIINLEQTIDKLTADKKELLELVKYRLRINCFAYRLENYKKCNKCKCDDFKLIEKHREV
jgi:hypothetical protein